ncbi:hypothetical protein D082_06910 [Synechocystis sp. PCC 6714]|nr:hypothetical protein D082_06910 [Synechocystis sp. PCC 6714]
MLALESWEKWLAFQTTTQHNMSRQKYGFDLGELEQFFFAAGNCENLLKILTLSIKSGINFGI